MAVTVEELAISLRLSPDGLGLSAAQTGILSRYLGVGTAYIDLLLPTAPVDIQDECIIRLASYLHDQPLGRRDSYSNAWVYSGAGALASKFQPPGGQWRARRRHYLYGRADSSASPGANRSTSLGHGGSPRPCYRRRRRRAW